MPLFHILPTKRKNKRKGGGKASVPHLPLRMLHLMITGNGTQIIQRSRKGIPGSTVYIDKLSFMVGFPGSSVVKNQLADAGDSGSIPESGRFPREGNGYPFQHSCLKTEEPGRLQSMGSQGVGHE